MLRVEFPGAVLRRQKERRAPLRPWRAIRPSLRLSLTASPEGSKGPGDTEYRDSDDTRSFCCKPGYETNRTAPKGAKQSSSGSLAECTHAAEARRGRPQRSTNRHANKCTIDESIQPWVVAATAIMRKNLITNGCADEKPNKSSGCCRQQSNRARVLPRIRGSVRTEEFGC